MISNDDEYIFVATGSGILIKFSIHKYKISKNYGKIMTNFIRSMVITKDDKKI